MGSQRFSINDAEAPLIDFYAIGGTHKRGNHECLHHAKIELMCINVRFCAGSRHYLVVGLFEVVFCSKSDIEDAVRYELFTNIDYV